MKLTHPELRDRLSAEYVLGTLSGAARRRFEQHMLEDASLRDIVARWEAHLTPLAERVPPVEPPPRVWQAIESRLMPRQARAGVWWSLAFWRAWGLGASGLAGALLMALMLRGTATPEAGPMLTAVLADDGDARMVVEQPGVGVLKVKMIKPWKTLPDNSLELWVIPKNGAPRSIGLMLENGDTLIRRGELDALLADGAVFALSKEPKGGSPTGAPTGAVLCKGMIAHMPPAKPASKPQA